MFGFVSRKKHYYAVMRASNICTASVAHEREFYKRQLDAANARLAEIAAMETPNCAHIGKKMARIAKGLD